MYVLLLLLLLLCLEIVKGVGYLNSFSDNLGNLWFVYRIVTDFLKLMLYTVILLKVSVSSGSSMVAFWGLLFYTIIFSVNRGTVTSCFLIWVILILITYPIALIRTLNTIFNRDRQCGRLILFLNLVELL